MKIGDQDWQRLANRHQRWQDALYGVFDGQRTQTMDGRVVLRHDVDAPCRILQSGTLTHSQVQTCVAVPLRCVVRGGDSGCTNLRETRAMTCNSELCRLSSATRASRACARAAFRWLARTLRSGQVHQAVVCGQRLFPAVLQRAGGREQSARRPEDWCAHTHVHACNLPHPAAHTTPRPPNPKP